jgi:hypothetical protein
VPTEAPTAAPTNVGDTLSPTNAPTAPPTAAFLFTYAQPSPSTPIEVEVTLTLDFAIVIPPTADGPSWDSEQYKQALAQIYAEEFDIPTSELTVVQVTPSFNAAGKVTTVESTVAVADASGAFMANGYALVEASMNAIGRRPIAALIATNPVPTDAPTDEPSGGAPVLIISIVCVVAVIAMCGCCFLAVAKKRRKKEGKYITVKLITGPDSGKKGRLSVPVACLNSDDEYTLTLDEGGELMESVKGSDMQLLTGQERDSEGKKKLVEKIVPAVEVEVVRGAVHAGHEASFTPAPTNMPTEAPTPTAAPTSTQVPQLAPLKIIGDAPGGK